MHICSAYAMRRSDKQPDRVEISPEQLSAAAIEAEVSFREWGWLTSNKYCFIYLASSYQVESPYSSARMVSQSPSHYSLAFTCRYVVWWCNGTPLGCHSFTCWIYGREKIN